MSEIPAATSYEIRPLSVAEILDAGFQLMRNHFVLLGSLSLVGQIPTILVTSAFAWMLDPFWFQKGEIPEIGATFVLIVATWLLALLVVLPVAIGAITSAVGDLYLGAPLSIRSCLDRGLARMFPLMITYLIFSIILTVAVALAVVGLGVVGGILGALLKNSSLGVALLIVAILAAIPALFALAGLMTLVPGVLAAVVVLEGRSLFDAVARTFTLVQAEIGRLVGVGLVLYMLVMIVPAGVQFTVGAIPIVGALVWGAVQALCQAYLYTTSVVAYFDVRCRTESFDLEHLAQLVEGSEPSAVPIR